MSVGNITIDSILEVAEQLKYRGNSVKKKALDAILSFYEDKDSPDQVPFIDTDELVVKIWDLAPDDHHRIRTKRRNFFSLRSSIVTDLEKLVSKDLNPENITISPANTFDMTEEAKRDLLSSFTNAVGGGNLNLEQAAEVLKAISEYLGDMEPDQADKSFEIIKDLKNILERLSTQEDEEFEEIEQDDEIEEIEELDEEEFEEVEEDEFLDEDEIEEIDEEDEEEFEEIEDDEILDEDEIEQLDEDEEILEDEEIEELSEDEILDDDEIEDIEEIEEEDEDEEEFEEIEEDEILEEDEIEQIEDSEEVEDLTEEEQQLLEEFRESQELARQFDNTLSDRERKFNTYVMVPGGLYTIGSKKTLTKSLEPEEIEMPTSYIGKYPVTNALFEIFVDQTGYVTTAEKQGFGMVYFSRFKTGKKQASWKTIAGSRKVKGACWYQPTGPGSSLHDKRNHPVVQVSVEDAIVYASWIGRRLPTEAEWEAAARTDLGNLYPWGDQFNLAALNIQDSAIADTCAVDEHDEYANAFGICDMLGNIMEWTSDTQENERRFGKKRIFHVARGGGWNSTASVTVGSRGVFAPDFTANIMGFRCISEVSLA